MFYNSYGGVSIFLTGGTGFLGKWLLDGFCSFGKELDTKVTVLTRNPEQFLRGNPKYSKRRYISFLKGDVRDFFIDGSFDYLIHAATPAGKHRRNIAPEELYSIIVDGTRNVLEKAKSADVKKILFVSSGAVYGAQPPETAKLPEEFPAVPASVYGKGKLEAERICLESGIDSAVARCFAFAGAYLPLDAQYAIGNFIGDAIRGRTIVIKGDGRAYRSYMYAADLVEWLWTILLDSKSGSIYNVGSEHAVSIEELAKLISNITVPAVSYKVSGTPVPGVPAPRYIPDTSKAQRELGLRENYSLEYAVRRMIDANR